MPKVNVQLPLSELDNVREKKIRMLHVERHCDINPVIVYLVRIGLHCLHERRVVA